MYCFHDPTEAAPGERLTVVHVHTLTPWAQRVPGAPLGAVTSVNVRHAHRAPGETAFKQEQRKWHVVPRSKELTRRGAWQALYKDGKRGELEWRPRDAQSVPQSDGDPRWRNAYAKTRAVILAGETLCGGAVVTAGIAQTERAMRGGGEGDAGEGVEYEVVGVAAQNSPTPPLPADAETDAAAEAAEASDSAPQTPASTTQASTSPPNKSMQESQRSSWRLRRRSVCRTTSPCGRACRRLRRRRAGPFASWLSARATATRSRSAWSVEKMRIAFCEEWGTEAWLNVVTFEVFYFTDTERLVQALQRYKPVGVHVVCHGFTSALSLHRDLASVDRLAEAFAAWVREPAGSGLRFLVANSCDSAHLANVLAAHVDLVVGHHMPVRDADALKFARALYGSLGRGMQFKNSFDMAKAASGSTYCLRGRKDATKFAFSRPGPAPAPAPVPSQIHVKTASCQSITLEVELGDSFDTIKHAGSTMSRCTRKTGTATTTACASCCSTWAASRSPLRRRPSMRASTMRRRRPSTWRS